MTAAQFLKALKRTAPLVFLWGVLSIWADQWVVGLVTDELSSPQGASPTVWLWAFLSMLISLTGPLILMLLILASNASGTIWAFITANLEQLVIEQLRAFGKIFSWSFAFIIPGVIKFFQFLFVPFVVLIDPLYPTGQVDALKESTLAFRKNAVASILVVGMFGLLLPLILSALDEYQSFSHRPILATAMACLQTAFSILMVFILQKLWHRHLKTRPSQALSSTEGV